MSDVVRQAILSTDPTVRRLVELLGERDMEVERLRDEIEDCHAVDEGIAADRDEARAEVRLLREALDAKPDLMRNLRLSLDVERLRTAANSARALLERHRATRGSNDLLTTALRELDDVLPPVVTTQQNHKPEERSGA